MPQGIFSILRLSVLGVSLRRRAAMAPVGTTIASAAVAASRRTRSCVLWFSA
ncbi:hypothetical protein JYK04_04623 [Streptomyces nojiriensis]|nr:hypothetical protein JYK04_04623 [Streptomyces nojiriensis]